MNISGSLVAATTFVLALGGCRSGSEPEIRTIKFSHVYATDSDYQQMAERFRDLMHERTDGRVQVEIYPSGQLGDERVTFEQLQFGAQDMAISGTPVLSSWVPEGQIFDLPFLFETREQGRAALEGVLGEWWRELLLEKTGVRPLGFLEYGFRHVYNRERPIEGPEDLSGLKLRVLQNPAYIRTYDAYGVQPTPMAYGEVYSALQQGVIDGGEANVIGFVTDRFYEVAPYFSFTSITYNPVTLLINERFYRSLPVDIKTALDRSAADALALQRRVAGELRDRAIRQMEEAGIEMSYPDLSPLANVVRPYIWDEVANGLPEGEQLLQWVREEIRRIPPKPWDDDSTAG